MKIITDIYLCSWSSLFFYFFSFFVYLCIFLFTLGHRDLSFLCQLFSFVPCQPLIVDIVDGLVVAMFGLCENYILSVIWFMYPHWGFWINSLLILLSSRAVLTWILIRCRIRELMKHFGRHYTSSTCLSSFSTVPYLVTALKTDRELFTSSHPTLLLSPVPELRHPNCSRLEPPQ